MQNDSKCHMLSTLPSSAFPSKPICSRVQGENSLCAHFLGWVQPANTTETVPRWNSMNPRLCSEHCWELWGVRLYLSKSDKVQIKFKANLVHLSSKNVLSVFWESFGLALAHFSRLGNQWSASKMLPPSLSAVEARRSHKMGWKTLWRHEKWTTRLQCSTLRETLSTGAETKMIKDDQRCSS